MQGGADEGPVQGFLDAVPLPLVLIDAGGRVAAANDPARLAFGKGIVGRSYLAAFRQPALIEALEAVQRHGQPGQTRVAIAGEGRESVYRVTVAPMAAAGPRGILLTFEDIGEREQTEAMRRDFVANVSHELRTPLTALTGFIDTLRGAARDDAAARERFLGIMDREAARMIRLVRDLLSLSRVESEERQRPDRQIDLLVPLNSALATLRPVAEADRVTLRLDGAEAPVMLRADADQMTQVFANLIENAIKYGGAGKEVVISVTRLPHDAALRGPAVRVDVVDQGEGIAPEHLPRLTERFYRVDAHRSREKGGTGLGLAIVKHIVNRHRGRLRITSEKHRGSRFSVIFPED